MTVGFKLMNYQCCCSYSYMNFGPADDLILRGTDEGSYMNKIPRIGIVNRVYYMSLKYYTL